MLNEIEIILYNVTFYLFTVYDNLNIHKKTNVFYF